MNMLYYGDAHAQSSYTEARQKYDNMLAKIRRGEPIEKEVPEKVNPLKVQSFIIPKEPSPQSIIYTPFQKWFAGNPFTYTVALRANRRASNYANQGHALFRGIHFFN